MAVKSFYIFQFSFKGFIWTGSKFQNLGSYFQDSCQSHFDEVFYQPIAFHPFTSNRYRSPKTKTTLTTKAHAASTSSTKWAVSSKRFWRPWNSSALAQPKVKWPHLILFLSLSTSLFIFLIFFRLKKVEQYVHCRAR